MISPAEIKRLALRQWARVLQDRVSGNNFSPIKIDRIGKIRSGQVREQFSQVQHEVEILMQASKNVSGIGYLVERSEQSFRRSGSHELPKSILIETLVDYLHITGKKKDWQMFEKNFDVLLASLPSLRHWAESNVTWLLKPDINWARILVVCQYFLAVPKPNLYLRQLPLPIHTKFIEENTALLTSLLDFLIPDQIRNHRSKRFAERYFLKYDEPTVRIRVLDESLQLPNKINDLSIPLSSFQQLEIDCNSVFKTENKMNFLTLPPAPHALAIWSGGGFNISYLSNVEWLKKKDIIYWGDIDEHGFIILHQLRTYFDHARSVLMDLETYSLYEEFAVSAPPANVGLLSKLTAHENEMLNKLKQNPLKNRLEQERIPQQYAEQKIGQAILGA